MNGEWTTEYPKEPGYYWRRNYSRAVDAYSQSLEPVDPEMQVVEVALDHWGNVVFWECGSDVLRDKGDIISAEWLGPIQPPDDKASSLTELFHRSLTSRGKQVLASQAIDDLGSLPLEGVGK